MIPKIIHYHWFSGEPMPEHLQGYIARWAELMPSYELRLWDGPAARSIGVPFVDEALDQRKWAFASDYVRFWTIYHEGGIYLDTDIEVFQPFDKFLSHRLFCGNEVHVYETPSRRTLTSHVFGAEPGHPLVRECMRYYENRHFYASDDARLPKQLRLSCLTSPVVMADLAEALYDYNKNGMLDKRQDLPEGITVYPSYYFDGPLYRRDPLTLHSIHRQQSAWHVGRTANQTVLNHGDLRHLRQPLSMRIISALNRLMMTRLGFTIHVVRHPRHKRDIR